MGKKKILIVDDDQDLLRALKIRLESQNYIAVFAADVDSTVNRALEEKPDVILLDLGLAEDNGFMVMEKLRQDDFLASIPVVVMTGRSAEVYKDAALAAGAQGFLQKPIDNGELLTKIRVTLMLNSGKEQAHKE
jgi:DNA-binding response OmpR family regulator